MKVCVKCKLSKALDEFYNHKLAPDGKYTVCKWCHNRRYRRKEAREKSNAAAKRVNLQLRTEVLDFLGNKCTQCGFSDKRALQIDHVNGGGHQEVKAIGKSAMMKRVLQGSTDYQLLCANCNWIKRVVRKEYGNSGVVL